MDILDNVNDDTIDNTNNDNIDNLENLDSSWWRCPSFFSLSFEIVCLCIEVSKFMSITLLLHVHFSTNDTLLSYGGILSTGMPFPSLLWLIWFAWLCFLLFYFCKWHLFSHLFSRFCVFYFSTFVSLLHMFSRFCFLLFRFYRYFPSPILHYSKIFNWLLICFLFWHFFVVTFLVFVNFPNTISTLLVS